eukprot:gnl/Trimastix_PCT/1816.p1 GENE.gnl/Trimastix_PCT/1816~~gnl/Trimastix_PCT/1816.p1  ORF type:complete len:4918 (+),score=1318.73 gnl/Trimastix_PCT/1816:53-14806(+)
MSQHSVFYFILFSSLFFLSALASEIQNSTQFLATENLENHWSCCHDTEVTIIPYHSASYKYKIVSHRSLYGFQRTQYDDSSWSTGDAGFGSQNHHCSLNNEEDAKTHWPINTDLLVRKQFSLQKRASKLLIKVAIDNDVQVWVNGHEVSRGMRVHEGCPSYDSFTFHVHHYMINTGMNLVAFRARDRGVVSFFDAEVIAYLPDEVDQVIPYKDHGWLYKLVRENQGSGFEQAAASESGFSTGRASFGTKFGYCILTSPFWVHTHWPHGRDILLRKHFTLTKTPEKGTLKISSLYYVTIYVNGHLIVPRRRAIGCPWMDRWTFTIPGDKLNVGDNVLAIRGERQRCIAFLDARLFIHYSPQCDPAVRCSGHGQCNADWTCTCDAHYFGDDCSKHCNPATTCHGHGNCADDATCSCHPGYTGTHCEDRTCPNDCSEHGLCNTATGVCKCDAGFAPLDCSQLSCPRSCSGHGTCDGATGNCQCHPGWQGEACDGPTCAVSQSRCNGHGTCVGFETCSCYAGWTGADCSVPKCDQVSDCSGHGDCVSPNQCRCQAGWSGPACNVPVCTGDCNAHGTCVAPETCSCSTGWTGDKCQTPVCTLLDGCSGHGTCVAPDQCLCAPGWKGPACQLPDCSQQQDCHAHGSCTAPNQCSCYQGWSGPQCSQPVCADNCHQQGACIAPGVCKCNEGYEGVTCGQAICAQGCIHGSCTAPGVCTCQQGWAGTACEQPQCPDVEWCSHHGDCVAPNTCDCAPGYNGTSCNLPYCTHCTHGTCQAPEQCVCHMGWSGHACDEPICTGDCSGHGDCTAPESCACHAGYTGPTCAQPICPQGCSAQHGSCTAPGVCTCHTGWAGDDCAQPVCPSDCSGHGTCTSPGICACAPGWKGTDCSQPICEDDCHHDVGHGTCASPGRCVCSAGWSGDGCEAPTCTGVSDCSGRGQCVSPDHCACFDGWTGASCSQAICTLLGDCHNHGQCVAPNQCQCAAGWSGADCNTPVCDEDCSGHGTCTQPGQCTCDSYWSGPLCATPLCPLVANCSGRGTCTGPNQCTCAAGWSGPSCSTPLCTGVKDCSAHGTCTQPDQCACQDGWTGPACDVPICAAQDDCYHADGHGNCTAPGVCTCKADYWGGADCSEPLCPTLQSCSGHGTCTQPLPNPACLCEPDWKGADCSVPKCDEVFECSGPSRGVCESPQTCQCKEGYAGVACELKLCPQNCSQHGSCNTTTGACLCDQGYEGSACELKSCPGDCSGLGTCNHQTGVCVCQEGHVGDDCSLLPCPIANGTECASHGLCNATSGHCLCSPGFQGDACQHLIMQCPDDCHTAQSHGSCDTMTGQCVCQLPWFGGACELKHCPGYAAGSPECSGRGTCGHTEGACTCDDGWTGDHCQTDWGTVSIRVVFTGISGVRLEAHSLRGAGQRVYSRSSLRDEVTFTLPKSTAGYRLLLSLGAHQVQLGPVDATQDTALFTDLTTTLTVSFANIRNVHAAVMLKSATLPADDPSLMVVSRCCQNDQAQFTLLRTQAGQAFTVLLKQGAKVKTITDIQCAGATCALADLTCRLTVPFDGLRNIWAGVSLPGSTSPSDVLGKCCNNDRVELTLFRSSESYHLTLRQGAQEVAHDLACDQATIEAPDLTATLAVTFPGLRNIKAVVQSRTSTPAGGQVYSRTSMNDGAQFRLLRAVYDVHVTQGAQTVRHTAIDCASGTCQLDGLVTSVEVLFPNVLNARVAVAVPGQPDGLVVSRTSLNHRASLAALRGTYDVTVMQGPATLAVRNVGCTGDNCTVSDLVCDVTIKFPGITNAQAALVMPDGATVVSRTSRNHEAGLTVLRGSYNAMVRQGEAEIQVPAACTGAALTLDSLTATLTVQIPGLTNVHTAVTTASGGAVLAACCASQSRDLVLLRRSEAYHVTLRHGAQSKTYTNVLCSAATCELKDITAVLTVHFEGVLNARVSVKTATEGIVLTSSALNNQAVLSVLRDAAYNVLVEDGEEGASHIQAQADCSQATCEVAGLTCALRLHFPGIHNVAAWVYTQDSVSPKLVVSRTAMNHQGNFSVLRGTYRVRVQQGGYQLTLADPVDCTGAVAEVRDLTASLDVDIHGVKNAKVVVLTPTAPSQTVLSRTAINDHASLAVLRGIFRVEVTQGPQTNAFPGVDCSHGTCSVGTQIVAQWTLRFPGLKNVRAEVVLPDDPSRVVVSRTALNDQGVLYVLFGTYTLRLKHGARTLEVPSVAVQQAQVTQDGLVSELSFAFPGVKNVAVRIDMPQSQGSGSVVTRTSLNDQAQLAVLRGHYQATLVHGALSWTLPQEIDATGPTTTIDDLVCNLVADLTGLSNVQARVYLPGTQNLVLRRTSLSGSTQLALLRNTYDIEIQHGAAVKELAAVPCTHGTHTLTDLTGVLTYQFPGLKNVRGEVHIPSGGPVLTRTSLNDAWAATLLRGLSYTAVLHHGAARKALPAVALQQGAQTVGELICNLDVYFEGFRHVVVEVQTLANERVLRRTSLQNHVQLALLRGQYHVLIGTSQKTYAYMNVDCSGPTQEVGERTAELALLFPGVTADVQLRDAEGSLVETHAEATDEAKFTILRGATYSVQLTHNSMVKTLSNVQCTQELCEVADLVSLVSLEMPGLTNVRVEFATVDDHPVEVRASVNDRLALHLLRGTYHLTVVDNGVQRLTQTVTLNAPIVNVTSIAAQLVLAYPGVVSVRAEVYAHGASSALVAAHSGTKDQAAFHLLRGEYRVVLRHGALRKDLGVIDCRSASTVRVEDLTTEMEIRFPEVRSVRASIYWQGGLVAARSSLSHSGQFTLLRAAYNVTLQQGAELKTVNEVDCQGARCLLDNLVSVVTVQFPSVHAVRVEVYTTQPSGGLVTARSGLSNTVQFHLLRSPGYRFKLRQGAAAHTVPSVPCEQAEVTLADLTCELHMQFPGVHSVRAEVLVPEGGLVIARSGLTNSGVFTLLRGTYQLDLLRGAARKTVGPVHCTQSYLTLDSLVSTLTLSFPGVKNVRVEIKTAEGGLVDAASSNNDQVVFSVLRLADYTVKLLHGAASVQLTSVSCLGPSVSLTNLVCDAAIEFPGVKSVRIEILTQEGGLVTAQSSLKDRTTFALLRGPTYQVKALHGGQVRTYSIVCQGATAVLQDITCALEVEFLGVSGVRAEVYTPPVPAHGVAPLFVMAQSGCADRFKTVLFRGHYRVLLKQGAASKELPDVDCTGPTAFVGGLICHLAVNVPTQDPPVATRIEIFKASDQLFVTAQSGVQNQAEFALFKDTYNVIAKSKGTTTFPGIVCQEDYSALCHPSCHEGTGTCTYPNTCMCKPGWFLPDCSQFGCPKNCSGRGVCDGGVCVCDEPYVGKDCSMVGALKDTFVMHDEAGSVDNHNEGGNLRLVVEGQVSMDLKHTLVAFDLSHEPQLPLKNAYLTLTVAGNDARWVNGKLEALPLLKDFTEGTAARYALTADEQLLGTGAGATWNCPADSNVTDLQTAGCPAADRWGGALENGASGSRTAPLLPVLNDQSGSVTLDVTWDVMHGHRRWVVRNTDEIGRIEFYSLQAAADQSQPTIAPYLRLTYDESGVCPADCSGHGRCVDQVCYCETGYGGDDCSLKLCPNNCWGAAHGTCLANGTCVCVAPWTGTDCSKAICPGDCSGHGVCVQGKCYCDKEYDGLDCSHRLCPSNCTDASHGTCDTATGICTCKTPWVGTDCSQAVCLNDCSGHGTCDRGTCVCERDWFGEDCSATCPVAEPGHRIGCRGTASVDHPYDDAQVPLGETEQFLSETPCTGCHANILPFTVGYDHYHYDCKCARMHLASPQLASLILDNTGVSVTATFDSATDKAGMTGAGPCTALWGAASLSLLGNDPQCVWVNDRQLTVKLGPGASLLPGHSLTLLESGLVRSANGLSPPVPTTSMAVQPPAHPIAPQATLVAPSVVTPCDPLVLDGTLSSGSGGRTLQFNWTLANPTDADALLVQFLAEVSELNYPKVYLVPQLLRSEYEYQFRLTVRNFLGAAAETQKAVFKGQVGLPVVIDGPDHFEFVKSTAHGVFLRLRARVLPALCLNPQDWPATDTLLAQLEDHMPAAHVNSPAARAATERQVAHMISRQAGMLNENAASNMFGNYDYEWSQTEGPAVPILLWNQKNLAIPIHHLVGGEKYVFTVYAAWKANPAMFGTDSVTFTVALDNLLAVIDGGSFRQVPQSQDLVLDASHSVDLSGELIPFSYRWSCVVSGTSDRCFALPLPITSSITISAGALDPGRYTFSCRVSKFTRSAIATVEVEVLPGAPPVITMDPLPTAKVSPSEQLALHAAVTGDAATLAMQWSVVQGDLPLTAETLYSGVVDEHLVIREHALVQGQTYVFRMTASDTHGEAYADLTVPVNEPPQTGTFTVSADAGTALNTTFTFTCHGWVDEDTPLRYQFGYTVYECTTTTTPGGGGGYGGGWGAGWGWGHGSGGDETTTTCTEQVVWINEPQEANTISGVMLPSGDESRGHKVKVYARVFDSFLASVEVAHEIVVSPVPQQETNAATDATVQRCGEILTTQLQDAMRVRDLELFAQLHHTVATELLKAPAQANADWTPAQPLVHRLVLSLRNMTDALTGADRLSDTTAFQYAMLLQAVSQQPGAISDTTLPILVELYNAFLVRVNDQDVGPQTYAVLVQALSQLLERARGQAGTASLYPAAAIEGILRKLSKRQGGGEDPSIVYSSSIRLLVYRNRVRRVAGQTLTPAGLFTAPPVNATTSAVQFRLPTRGLLEGDQRELEFALEEWASDVFAHHPNVSTKLGALKVLFGDSPVAVSKLAEPITIVLPKTRAAEAGMQYECRYYNTFTSDWSPEGCTLATETEGEVHCACNHLTLFSAVQVPIPAPRPTPSAGPAQAFPWYIAVAASAAVLAIAVPTVIVILLVVRRNRALQNKTAFLQKAVIFNPLSSSNRPKPRAKASQQAPLPVLGEELCPMERRSTV